MKSIQGGKSHLLGATTMGHVPLRCRASDDLKERAINAVTLSAVVVAIVALYAVMFVGFYRWTHYAPLLPPENGAAITQLE